MTALIETIWQGLAGATPLEQSATILGLLGVWLATRQSLWNFPVGLVQVVLAGIVFSQQRLFADACLQAVYFIALAWGWWCWTHPANDRRASLPVTTLSTRHRIWFVVAGLMACLAWGLLLDRVGDPMPWRDAFIAAFGVISQWLEAHKKIEAWLGWVMVNLAGIGVYAAIGLYWFVGLYLIYLVLSFIGLVSWRRSMQHEDTT
ncbi:nicotinamide riboside transporter PnuC [Salinisphaera sp. Q1T1-3]|uniref:nicotinamide riboside transporter PnuC n=1 Tax=Salinisphaera sp. Q1T1-3 TaxID=2321229 RepID=UPI001314F3A2|nr:nicotinamide riboside transporter PnuC [Salinisphaera sp. Q1T1-3]